MKFQILLYSALCLPLFAQAGNEVGNGGDVVVCKDGGVIKSIELLDFYEARIEERAELNLGQDHLPPIARVNSVLEQIKKHSPKLADQYKKRLDAFFSEVNFIEKAGLKDIGDSAHLIQPKDKNCEIQQVAIMKKGMKLKKKFLVDKSLWSKMDDANKAGLILHEIVYEHLAYLGEKNSMKVRHINAMFFEKDFAKMDSKSYWKKFRDLKLPIYRNL